MINDIELVHSENGCFDWSMGFDDVMVVRNDNQLRNAVIHSIFLKPFEIENDSYFLKGNPAHDHVKSKPTKHVQALIEENISNICKEIVGVTDAKTNLTYQEDDMVINVILLKDNGEEVVIDGITL